MSNYNAKTLILLPKIYNVDSIELFRPIALANFKFKIISKVIANRLSPIISIIISMEQKGFVQGRCIKECIGLTSEVVNLMHKKSYGGNLVMKVEIKKAFNSINWLFLTQVLKQFGFNDILNNWIWTILHSSKISISFNENLHEFYECGR